MNTFRERLNELIEKREKELGKKVSQTEIAKAAGLSQAQISEYVNTDVDPSLSVVIGIAKFFNVGLDYFNQNGQVVINDNMDDVRLLNNVLMKQVEDLRGDKEELKKDKQNWREQNQRVWEQNERIWTLIKGSGSTLNAG